MKLGEWKRYYEWLAANTAKHIAERGADDDGPEYEYLATVLDQLAVSIRLADGTRIVKGCVLDDRYREAHPSISDSDWVLILPDDTVFMNKLDGKTPYFAGRVDNFLHDSEAVPALDRVEFGPPPPEALLDDRQQPLPEAVLLDTRANLDLVRQHASHMVHDCFELSVEQAMKLKAALAPGPLRDHLKVLLFKIAYAPHFYSIRIDDPGDGVERCPKCGHAPHGPVCLNMASDNECNCTHDSRKAT